MIDYDPGRFGVCFVLNYKGSVFPKALVWAIPNAALAILLHMYGREEQTIGNPMSMTGIDMMWTGYTAVLGFLVVFRNNQAYTRFWEGATLINQVRGEWFNAVSTLFAFCNHSPAYREKVDQFQHTLIRLASMLYCSALQQVCDLDDDWFEIIEIRGMEDDSIRFMQESADRVEIILCWIQRLIVDANEEDVIKIAPPILTRAFQELSRGIVNVNSARKIKDIPFPFPYSQMITLMLLVHWLATPVIASQVMESAMATGAVCFFVTFSLWCLLYIALEIDQPFGEDANDLPLREMQRDFNCSLLTLMHPLTQRPPGFRMLERQELDRCSGDDEELVAPLPSHRATHADEPLDPAMLQELGLEKVGGMEKMLGTKSRSLSLKLEARQSKRSGSIDTSDRHSNLRKTAAAGVIGWIQGQTTRLTLSTRRPTTSRLGRPSPWSRAAAPRQRRQDAEPDGTISPDLPEDELFNGQKAAETTKQGEAYKRATDASRKSRKASLSRQGSMGSAAAVARAATAAHAANFFERSRSFGDRSLRSFDRSLSGLSGADGLVGDPTDGAGEIFMV